MNSNQSSFGNTTGMNGISRELLNSLPDDSEIWINLKQAIAASSGFQRWRLENSSDSKLSSTTLDSLVRCYLRDTLETLAY